MEVHNHTSMAMLSFTAPLSFPLHCNHHHRHLYIHRIPHRISPSRRPRTTGIRIIASLTTPPSPITPESQSPPSTEHPGKSQSSLFHRLSRLLATVGLAAFLFTTTIPTLSALAASAGGRMGGSYFRSSPSVPRSLPRGGVGGGFGGGWGLGPSVLVVPGGGYYGYGYGGGGFGVLGLVLVGGLLMTAVSRVGSGIGSGGLLDEEVREGVGVVDGGRGCVVTVKVGLLANARKLGLELERVARKGDTGSAGGLRMVMEDVVVALLRCDDYWAYGAVDEFKGRGREVEREFGRRSMNERLKIETETMSNVGGRYREMQRARAMEPDYSKTPNEFIVVSMTIAADGDDVVRKIPKVVNSTADLRRTLEAVASTTTKQLQGCEIVWAPQSMQDVLTKQEMLLDHPELRRL